MAGAAYIVGNIPSGTGVNIVDGITSYTLNGDHPIGSATMVTNEAPLPGLARSNMMWLIEPFEPDVERLSVRSVGGVGGKTLTLQEYSNNFTSRPTQKFHPNGSLIIVLNPAEYSPIFFWWNGERD